MPTSPFNAVFSFSIAALYSDFNPSSMAFASVNAVSTGVQLSSVNISLSKASACSISLSNCAFSSLASALVTFFCAAINLSFTPSSCSWV